MSLSRFFSGQSVPAPIFLKNQPGLAIFFSGPWRQCHKLIVTIRLYLLPLLLLLVADTTLAKDPYSFEDLPSDYQGEYPEWFKASFNDLQEDLADTLDSGKRGLIVYFGQKYCPYCEAIMEENLTRPDLVTYLRTHFDVIALNTQSVEEFTDLDGEVTTVRDFAIRQRTHFTPSLLFYTEGGRLALKLVGYYPQYKMRAALEYVADGHYQEMRFARYLELADPPGLFDDEVLIPDALFSAPPYALDRSRFPGETPLLVIFEQGDCHACDVLHTEPLQNPGVRERLRDYEIVQLNLWDDKTPVITPAGERTTPRQWAQQLGLFYTPTLLFFDERGREVFRVDSVVQFYRLAGVLRYVAEKGYETTPLFRVWNREHAREEVEYHKERTDGRGAGS